MSNVNGKRLVMYSRTTGCPYISIAKRVLNEHDIAYHEVFIDLDAEAKQRVVEWTGFLSVPTMIIAHEGEILPYEPPAYLEKGATPRGVNRGSMLTEANATELEAWLRQHGFL